MIKGSDSCGPHRPPLLLHLTSAAFFSTSWSSGASLPLSVSSKACLTLKM